MPSVSNEQRKALYAKFGSAWVHAHHFDVVDPSARKHPKKIKKRKKR